VQVLIDSDAMETMHDGYLIFEKAKWNDISTKSSWHIIPEENQTKEIKRENVKVVTKNGNFILPCFWY
jgi:hypothetical protein